MEYNKAQWLKAAKEVQELVLSQEFFADFKKGKVKVQALPEDGLLMLTTVLLDDLKQLPEEAPSLEKEEAELEKVSAKIVATLESKGFSYEQLDPYNSDSSKLTDVHHVYSELQAGSEDYSPSIGLTYSVVFVKKSGSLTAKRTLQITIME